MSTSEVRLATASDRGAVAAMLGRAFRDDPAFSYILPDPGSRERRLARLFGLMLASDATAGMALVGAGGEAAASWRGPGRARVGWGEMLRQALPILGALGGALPRALGVSAAIEARFPAEPFWYLHVVGCEPTRQGEGLGGAVIRAGLRRAAGRLPCYLETATEANVGFYAGLGFRVTGEWIVPRSTLRFWSMLRPAEA
jgi:ribosomal protein S18 acetylase RimI-like enzyme